MMWYVLNKFISFPICIAEAVFKFLVHVDIILFFLSTTSSLVTFYGAGKGDELSS